VEKASRELYIRVTARAAPPPRDLDAVLVLMESWSLRKT